MQVCDCSFLKILASTIPDQSNTHTNRMDCGVDVSKLRVGTYSMLGKFRLKSKHEH